MLHHIKLETLDDYFRSLGERKSGGVYFYRINGYNESVGRFIKKYYEAAGKQGVIIEGRIPNPDDRNLAYYHEIMGTAFQLNLAFITVSLQKWLPRMTPAQRSSVAEAMYECLDRLYKGGKTESILHNAYIKFMCWLYYRFEGIVNRLGHDEVPKILYEGEISSYELMLMSILSKAGCDVVLLQYNGDRSYAKLDPLSELSDSLCMPGLEGFPEGYSLKTVERELQEAARLERLYGTLPSVQSCTNAWIRDRDLIDAVRMPIHLRGEDNRFFYNCFCRISGVEDKLTYCNSLYRFNTELKNSGRKVVITDGEITAPDVEEIGTVRRKNAYQRQDQMLMDLIPNIRYKGSPDLQALIRKAFIDVMLQEAGTAGMNLNKLMNKAVYLICWLNRYLPDLFSGWKYPDVSCFIHFGVCRNYNEALFLRLLAKLPADVVILAPNLNETCVLEDPLLVSQAFGASMNVPRFPRQASDLQVGTSAYHAEQELDVLLYQDSGMYRDQQYGKANAITLKTMYEEIPILWREEVKYRPFFEANDGIVNVPVIFAKISGVKNGNADRYWDSIRELMREEVCLIPRVPVIGPASENPIKAFATEFLRGGKLQRSRIRNHKHYPYGFLREDVQEHILDKLQLLIEQKVIKGTFENGTEYTIISTVLNMSLEIVRMMQKFDFTKKNPKLIYVIADEKMFSLENTITAAFLNMIGFDILFFVPTGYRSVERYFNTIPFEEHQIGEYKYDLTVPDLTSPPLRPSRPSGSWRNLFRRGKDGT